MAYQLPGGGGVLPDLNQLPPEGGEQAPPPAAEVDRISSLPEKARQRILSFLPLKSAVMLGMVSSSWSRLVSRPCDSILAIHIQPAAQRGPCCVASHHVRSDQIAALLHDELATRGRGPDHRLLRCVLKVYDVQTRPADYRLLRWVLKVDDVQTRPADFYFLLDYTAGCDVEDFVDAGAGLGPPEVPFNFQWAFHHLLRLVISGVGGNRAHRRLVRSIRLHNWITALPNLFNLVNLSICSSTPKIISRLSGTENFQVQVAKLRNLQNLRQLQLGLSSLDTHKLSHIYGFLCICCCSRLINLFVEVDGQSEEVIFDHLHATAFQYTSLGRPILGTADNVKSVTKEDLENYIATHSTAPRMVISAAGNVKHEDIVKHAKKLLNKLPTDPTTTNMLVTKESASFTGSEVQIIDEDTPLAQFAVAFNGASWVYPDSLALMVMQSMLGSWNKSASGRKHMGSELVQRSAINDIAESVMAFNTNYKDTGLFGVYAVAKEQLVLALKMETELLLELAPSEAVPRAVIQGGQDTPVKSSFSVCKPKRTLVWPSTGFMRPTRRTFSSLPRVNNSDLQPLYDTIGHINNVVHWPLNGTLPTMKSNYDACIGHIRLYNCVHGKSFDVSKILGSKKIMFTTALSGTLYVRVTLEEGGKLYGFTLIADGREGWNYAFKNRHGVWEYKNSASNPYVVGGETRHLDFESHYEEDGLSCRSEGITHGVTLMGPEAVKVGCKILSEYNGLQPAPLQVRMACAIFINYLMEAPKFHDVHYFDSLSLVCGSICTMDEVDPALSLIMKRWSKLSEPSINFLVDQLYSSPTQPIHTVNGIENLESMVNALAIVPFNRIPKPGGNVRTWHCFAKDQNTDEQPHALSLNFLRRWPYHESVVLNRPPQRTVDLAAAGPFARKEDLTKPKILKYINKVVNPLASRHTRIKMLQQTCAGLKYLNWLKACV